MESIKIKLEKTLKEMKEKIANETDKKAYENLLKNKDKKLI